MPFRLRAAVLADLDTLVRFNQAMARETEDRELDAAVLQPGVRRVLEDAHAGRYFVAISDGVDDGAVVGQIMVTTEWSDWRNGHFFWIQSVYVAEAWRRQGVYTALHAHVIAVARARGDVVGVRLYVEPDNERARRTYKKLGMTKTYDVMEQKI